MNWYIELCFRQYRKDHARHFGLHFFLGKYHQLSTGNKTKKETLKSITTLGSVGL